MSPERERQSARLWLAAAIIVFVSWVTFNWTGQTDAQDGIFCGVTGLAIALWQRGIGRAEGYEAGVAATETSDQEH